MMGCHFQDRPRKVSLCLRGLHVGEGRSSLALCNGSTEESCPHRAWDHGVHLQVCKERDESICHCPGCGGRHSNMMEALRCELARSILESFSDGGSKPIGESIPQNLRASAWRMIRKGVIARDGGNCRLCGKDLSKVPSWLTEVHHIQPRNRGGEDHPSNLLTLCTMCHKRVTNDALIAEGGEPSISDQFLPRESLEALR